MNAVDELDARVRRAMRQIADTAPVTVDSAGAVARLSRPVRRRPAVPLLAAAAILAIVAGAVWLLARPEEARLDPADQPPMIPTTETAPTSTDAPATAAPSALTIPEPAALAIVDPALGWGDPVRQDPYQQWLHGRDRPEQWFVRTDASGAPTGGIKLQLLPASEWEKSFSDGEPIEVGAGVAARVMADAARPIIGWGAGDAVRSVVGVGGVGLEEVAAIASVVASADEVTDVPGFAPVAVPQGVASVSYPDSRASISVSRPADGEQLDARTTLFMSSGGGAVTPAGPGWEAPLGTSRVIALDLDAPTQIVATLDDSDIDVADFAAALRFVPPADVAISPAGLTIAPGTPVDGGEVSAGRWLRAAWSEQPGQVCSTFQTSWAGGRIQNCRVVLPTAPLCESVVAGGIDGPRFAVLVDADVETVAVRVDGGEPVTAPTLERSGGYTIATGSLPADPTRSIEVLVDWQAVSC